LSGDRVAALNGRDALVGAARRTSPPDDGHEVTLVAFDGSPTSVAALDWAVDRCARLSADTSALALLLVEGQHPGRLRAEERQEELLQAAETRRAALPGTPVLTRTRTGQPEDVLVDAAGAADVVVVGSGLQPHLMRRTLAERLWARGVPRTVVVPPVVADGPVRVVVTKPLPCDATLAWAATEARLRGVDLEVIEVSEESDHDRLGHRLELEDIERRITALAPGRPVTARLLRGEPVEAWRRLSAEAGLVVFEADPADPHAGERLRRGLLLAVLAPTALLAPASVTRASTAG
jgi:uncharacterized glyoxalase superfamily metalloenzyme YdcJ